VATRGRPLEDYHWVYVPEEQLPFYRVGFFSGAMPSMAPPGCSSIYVELAARENRENRATTIANAVRALLEIKAVASVEDVLFADLREIKNAYVIYDDNYEPSRACLFPYLERHQIFSRGRYGSWVYHAMEDSLLDGREAATRVDALPVFPSEGDAR
jgi:protoporphyrinogen oxidase